MARTPSPESPEHEVDEIFTKVENIDDLMNTLRKVGEVIDSNGRAQDVKFVQKILSEAFIARMSGESKDNVDYILSKLTRRQGLREAGIKVLEGMFLGKEKISTKKVKEAQSFDELYKILEGMIVIKGSREYKSEDMISRIKEAVDFVAKGGIDPSTADINSIERFVLGKITNGEELRDTVRRLLLGDVYVRRFEEAVRREEEAEEADRKKGEEEEKLKVKIKALKVLGLGEDASPEVVKDRFRELIKQFHPDRATGGEKALYTERTKQIIAAYDELHK